MFTALSGLILALDKRRPNARDPVCGNGHTDAGATDEYTPFHLSRGNRFGNSGGVIGVVAGISPVGPLIFYPIALLAKGFG